MIDKCSCGATCSQVETLLAEVERLIRQNNKGMNCMNWKETFTTLLAF